MMTQDHRSKAFHELSALVLNIIRSPPPPLDQDPATHRRRRSMSPAGLASLLLGISLSLMLCGSLTFFIGFLLMPWVLSLVVFLYFVGLLSSVSMIGRSILCCNSSPRKDAAPAPAPAPASWKT